MASAIQDNGENVSYQNFRLRVAAQVIFDDMPDEAIPEVFDALIKIVEHWRTPVVHPTISIPQLIPAQMGEVIIRPVFPVMEDYL